MTKSLLEDTRKNLLKRLSKPLYLTSGFKRVGLRYAKYSFQCTNFNLLSVHLKLMSLSQIEICPHTHIVS